MEASAIIESMTDFCEYSGKTFTFTIDEETRDGWVLREPTAKEMVEIERKRHEDVYWQDLAIFEIARTFRETNICKNDGNPIIPENSSLECIESVLGVCPADVLYEIWNAVGNAFPSLGPEEKTLVQFHEDYVDDEFLD